MDRYLLFNSNCNTCARIAQSIEPETEGWLAVRSLHNPEMQSLLAKANPRWPWKPTLLVINGSQITTQTGMRMGLSFLFGLGPIRVIRIAYRLQAAGVLGAVASLLIRSN